MFTPPPPPEREVYRFRHSSTRHKAGIKKADPKQSKMWRNHVKDKEKQERFLKLLRDWSKPERPRLGTERSATNLVRTFLLTSWLATLAHFSASVMALARVLFSSDSGNFFSSASCNRSFSSHRSGRKPPADKSHQQHFHIISSWLKIFF